MILNDKFFDREIELRKCFEDGVPLVKFDIETKSYIDCENPNFEESDCLKIKLPNHEEGEELGVFLENNRELIKKLNYKNEQYVIFKVDFYDPYEITYEELAFVEMINQRIEHYAFKGTHAECLDFCNDFYEKHDKDYTFTHRHSPTNDIKDFINKIKYVMGNAYFPNENLNELYNLLYVNNDAWEKYLKEQKHKELEQKDIEFNENLIYHMVEEEKEN